MKTTGFVIRSNGALLALILLALPSVVAAEGDRQSLVGPQLYDRYCETCHGTNGDGRGASIPRLFGPPPADFTTGVYKFRSTPSGAVPTDADLIRTVRRGLPGTAMPAWGGILDDTQLAAVVSYVKAFSPRFASSEPVEVVAVPKVVPKASAASIARGRGVFLLMKCILCHGVDADGDGPDAPKLKDLYGRPIAPRDFSRAEFKGGAAPRDLYRTLATGIDGTPMVAYFADPEVLERPLLRLRDASAAQVLARPELAAEDRRHLRDFIAKLPSEASYDALTDEQRQALVQGWRWDLVHYIRSVGERGRFWRWLLGL